MKNQLIINVQLCFSLLVLVPNSVSWFDQRNGTMGMVENMGFIIRI